MLSRGFRILFTTSLKTTRFVVPTVKSQFIFTSNAKSAKRLNVVPNRFYSEQFKEEAKIVDYDYMKNAINDKKALIVDVREPDEIKEHGAIPNSINIPLGTVTSALTLSETEFEKKYNRKKPDENTEMILYCMIGRRSGMAQEDAIKLGYKNVKNYLGSWTEWAVKSKKQ